MNLIKAGLEIFCDVPTPIPHLHPLKPSQLTSPLLESHPPVSLIDHVDHVGGRGVGIRINIFSKPDQSKQNEK